MFPQRTSPAFIRCFQTVNLHVAVFCLGCVFGLTGATLLDLGDVYAASPKVVSYTILTRGIGSIVFCLAADAILRYVNIQHVMIVSLLVAGVSIGITPLVGELPLCHLAMFFFGGCFGLIEIASNGWIIGAWKERSGTIFQLYNFCFGLGGVLAPLVAEPFLGQAHSRTNETSFVKILADRSLLEEKRFFPVTNTRIHVPYLLLGAAFILNAAFMIVSFAFNRGNISPGESSSSDSTHSRRWEFTVVTAFCVYVFVIVSLEQSYISMLSVYVVKNEQLAFNKSNSAFVSAVFWISFTLARVASTFLSLRVQPIRMLIVCHIICLLGAVGLSFAGGWSAETVWICTALMGFGVSPMFATSLSHVMKYVLFSHGYMSYIILCVCAGGMMPALLVGPHMEDYPMILLHVNLTQAIIATLVMGFLVIFTYGKCIRPSMMKNDLSENDTTVIIRY